MLNLIFYLFENLLAVQGFLCILHNFMSTFSLDIFF